jgi:hypothetical protein
MASRSLVGSLATLTTSVVNLTILMVLKGEPGWICLMCCNADILFCVLVLHWVTSKDKVNTSTVGVSTGQSRGTRSRTSRIACAKEGGLEKRVEVEVISGKEDTATILEPHMVMRGPPVAVITTECRSSSPKALGPLHRTPTREELGEEVELRKIVVQTIHIQEVEVDHDRTDSVRSEGEEWVSVERRVVGEIIV